MKLIALTLFIYAAVVIADQITSLPGLKTPINFKQVKIRFLWFF